MFRQTTSASATMRATGAVRADPDTLPSFTKFLISRQNLHLWGNTYFCSAHGSADKKKNVDWRHYWRLPSLPASSDSIPSLASVEPCKLSALAESPCVCLTSLSDGLRSLYLWYSSPSRLPGPRKPTPRRIFRSRQKVRLLRTTPRTIWEGGQTHFCSEDSANMSQSPMLLRNEPRRQLPSWNLSYCQSIQPSRLQATM